MKATINLQSLLVLISSIVVLFFNFLTYFKNRKSKVNLCFAIFGVSIFIWLFSFAIAYSVKDLSLKLLLFKIGYIGIISIPINFYTFVHYLLENKKTKIILINYLIGVFFIVLNFSRNPLVVDLYKYPWGYYPKVSLSLHPFFLFYFISLFTFCLINLSIGLLNKDKFNTLRRIRIKYILIGSMFGVMGVVDNFASYKINIYPFGFIFMIIYPVILTYAIIKYRLMDITIAITRSGVFVATYSLILGIPFLVASTCRDNLVGLFGADKWWWVPMGLLTILATAGPFIYIFI
ncbi:MAG: histidine kinase N-terminal 7TM domain-containing protein, partial [Candidatus Firestonebacteria bacterium]